MLPSGDSLILIILKLFNTIYFNKRKIVTSLWIQYDSVSSLESMTLLATLWYYKKYKRIEKDTYDNMFPNSIGGVHPAVNQDVA